MKIALVSDCYPPRLGGIESQVHALAGRLGAAGHEVHVFTITPDEPRAQALPDQQGVHVHRLGLRWTLPRGWLLRPGAAHPLRPALAQRGFDVVHAHLGVVSPFATTGGRVALELGIPLAATWHSVVGAAAPVVRVLTGPAGWAARGAALSAVSNVAADALGQVTDAPIGLLPNGIDADFWRPAGAARPVDGPLRVVSAMRLAARKRPIPLLRAVASARQRTSADIELAIAGDGPDRARVERQRERVGATWCVLPGRIDAQGLRSLYRSADLYVSPSELEAFGIAAAEARAVGLPVLTMRGSAVAEFVRDGVDGFVVDDDEAMAASIASFASNEGLRSRLAARCVADRPDHGWGAVLAAVEREYARAMQGTGAPA